MLTNSDFDGDTLADDRAFAEALMQDVWIDGRVERIHLYYHADAEIWGVLPNMSVRPADLPDVVEQVSLFVDYRRFDMLNFVSDGAGRISFQMRLELWHKTVEKIGYLEHACYLERKAGRVSMSNSFSNSSKMLEQLELVPPDFMLLCMSGARFE